MIQLTRLTGSRFYLNAEHIQLVEATPDTHILLKNGQQYVAAEPAEEVAVRAIAYQRLVRRPWPLTAADRSNTDVLPLTREGKRAAERRGAG